MLDSKRVPSRSGTVPLFSWKGAKWGHHGVATNFYLHIIFVGLISTWIHLNPTYLTSFVDVISYLEEGDFYGRCVCVAGLAPWIDSKPCHVRIVGNTLFPELRKLCQRVDELCAQTKMDTQRGWRCFEHVECTFNVFLTDTVYDMYIFTIVYLYF